jgi:hypothetical protein
MPQEAEMRAKEKAAAAILAVFPTPERLQGFALSNENRLLLEGLIDFAARKGAIETADQRALEDFIRKNTRPTADHAFAKHLTFEELMDRKDELLGLDMSVRAMTACPFPGRGIRMHSTL